MPAPAAELCIITHTFYDASGTEQQGVLVRFTPTVTSERARNVGFVADEVTAESDAAGLLTITLFREMKGTLTITGIPLTREITVPDAATADLYDLVGGLPDPLSPVEIPFTFPPRRS